MELIDPQLKTYDDYAKTPEGASCQLIGGEIIMSPAPEVFHQDILGNIYFALRQFVDERTLGKVFTAPTDVYFNEHETFQPDILFVPHERLHTLKEKRIEGAPDLIVEVLSPSTGYYDLANKKEVYEQSGVKEYWIVDPKLKSIEVLTNQNGGFVTLAKVKKSGTVGSKLLAGFQIELASVFDRM